MTDDTVPASPSPASSADDFTSRVVSVVESVPEGRVMSYGSVAAAVGSRSSRGVGKVMAHAGSELPWWRVVRASGHAPEGHGPRALEHWRAEGTPLRWSRTGTVRVDLERASWWPDISLSDEPGGTFG
ncbi:DNA-binding protein [Frigoribacterium sp. ACAM 257]|uniref:MGMT family protein n=1 Tax=Frigoribacterium sp. ACAM 257 TaxID=2508998 RepID=UPI0011B9BAB9|nr:MGMT family protein [Frigoribacterium sp. ACAM 257]TWX38719.1 DNA-binding protein [Frigoribacterium sp. ACAM 257]